MVKDKLLTTHERMALRPDERARYVQKVLMDVLSVEKDLTLSEIVEKTGLARPTLTKHLELLSAKQLVLLQIRGVLFGLTSRCILRGNCFAARGEFF